MKNVKKRKNVIIWLTLLFRQSTGIILYDLNSKDNISFNHDLSTTSGVAITSKVFHRICENLTGHSDRGGNLFLGLSWSSRSVRLLTHIFDIFPRDIHRVTVT